MSAEETSLVIISMLSLCGIIVYKGSLFKSLKNVEQQVKNLGKI